MGMSPDPSLSQEEFVLKELLISGICCGGSGKGEFSWKITQIHFAFLHFYW